MSNDFYRPYDSIADAFDKGYDLGKAREEGDITIDSVVILQMIARLKATQRQYGTNLCLVGLIKELISLEQTVAQYERSEEEALTVEGD